MQQLYLTQIGIQKNFLIPVQLSESIPDGANADALRKIVRENICIYTWCDLHNIGNGKYKGMTDMEKTMEVPKNGGVGNKNKQKPLEDAYVSARNKNNVGNKKSCLSICNTHHSKFCRCAASSRWLVRG